MRIPYFSLLAAGALTLGGCAYGNYGGVGFGLGYGGGYGSVGYAGGYGYGDPYYGYGSPYYGWYDDYYYPGTGIYVYDSGRNRHVWNDRQRSYWSSRQQAVSSKTGTRSFRDNWSGFNRRSQATSSGQTTTGEHHSHDHTH
jgi:hypothetical protein